jgi:hypothetical protein
MQRFILRNWLILAITSILVAIYIWIFDGFVQGKSYMFFLLSVFFGVIYWYKLKKGTK